MTYAPPPPCLILLTGGGTLLQPAGRQHRETRLTFLHNSLQDVHVVLLGHSAEGGELGLGDKLQKLQQTRKKNKTVCSTNVCDAVFFTPDNKRTPPPLESLLAPTVLELIVFRGRSYWKGVGHQPGCQQHRFTPDPLSCELAESFERCGSARAGMCVLVVVVGACTNSVCLGGLSARLPPCSGICDLALGDLGR